MNMKLIEYAKKILLSGPSKYSTSDPELFKRVNHHSRVNTGFLHRATASVIPEVALITGYLVINYVAKLKKSIGEEK